MIFRKFTSILTLLTLLFTLTPFDYAANADDTDIALQLISSDAAFSSAENSAEPNDEALLLSDTILGSDGSDRVSYLSQGDNVLLSSNLNLSADATPDTLVVFDAAVTSDISNAVSYNSSNSKGSVSSDASAALSGSHTLKLNHAILPAGSQYEAKISRTSIPDITAYSYININMWSPEATDEKLNIILNSSGQSSSKRIRYILYTDWQGWKTVSIPYSSHSNNSLTSLTKTVDRFNINIGGWNFTKAKAGYFLVDKIWLTNSVPEKASYSSAEYENGQGYVSSDLGGDKTYSFTFDKALASVDMTGAVKYERLNGTDFEVVSSGYEAIGNGNNLDVVFSENLSDGTYKITLDPSKICTSEFVFGSGDDVSAEFSVNLPSPYFKLTSSSVADGSTLSSLNDIVLSFNNELNSFLYIPDYISLYCDGDKLYNSFNSSVDYNKLTLNFSSGLEAGHNYTLSISSSYGDILGNPYIGTSEICFTIAAQEEKTKLVIFSAENTDNFDILDSEYKISTDITNLYSQTAKLDYDAGSDDLNAFIARNHNMNVTGMKYLNFLAYSPVVTENPSYVILYRNNALVGNKYELAIDWSGWKIISIPVSSIATGTSFDGILFTMGTWKLENTTSGYLLIDAVWFSNDVPKNLQLESQSIPNNFSSAALNGQSIKLTFNSALDANVIPQILVADSSGNEFSDYTYYVSGNELEIILGDLISPGAEYTFTLSSVASEDFSLLDEPVVIKLSAATAGVFVNDISYSSKTVSFEIENLSDNSPSLTLTAYAIGEDNKLIEKKEKTISASNGVHNETIVFSSGEEIKQVKAFVLNGNKEFVSSKYLSYKNSASQILSVSYISGNTPVINDLSYSINVNLLTLKANLSALLDTAIVEITSSGEIISANVINAADGITYYYIFPSSAPSAIYPAKITSANVTSLVNVKYISKTDRDDILSIANSGNASSLSAKLKTLKAYLPVNISSDTLIDEFSSLAVVNKPYASYDELMNYIVSLNLLLTNLNSYSWSDLPALINTNSTLLKGINSTTLTYFLSLSDVNRGKLCAYLPSKLPAASITSFVAKLAEAVSEYKASLTSSVTPDVTGNNHTASPSVTGTSMSGASFSSALSSQPAADSGTGTVFTDLASVPWAEESINTLFSKGIISKSEDGRFRPNDSITREEFTKLVVCAFSDEQQYEQKLFSDSVDGAWYNKYISIAYDKGIATGYPDGSFGIGDNISREDMATLCLRAFTLTGKILPADRSCEFSDKSLISGYAVENVTKMAQAGIINGMGDGTFAPKANATRAQAAKIIAALIALN